MDQEAIYEYARESGTDRSARHIFFGLHGELYALPVINSIEVTKVAAFDMPPLLPRQPDYVVGTFAMHGQIIPVIDAGIRTGYRAHGLTLENSIVIIGRVGFLYYALLADRLYSVDTERTFSTQSPATVFSRHPDERFLSGSLSFEKDGKLLRATVLDFQRIVSGFDVQALQRRHVRNVRMHPDA